MAVERDVGRQKMEELSATQSRKEQRLKSLWAKRLMLDDEILELTLDLTGIGSL